jgi:flavin reductase (DIM6/NTAB) family NADH-FMN oxidoreductase RutF
MMVQKQEVSLITKDDGYPIFTPSVAVLISCADANGRANITPIVAWTIVSRFPFTVGIGLCNGHYSENYFPRYSRKVIAESGEFVLNFPYAGLIDAISICGSVSGFDPQVDKFALSGLTPGPCKVVHAPLILECPVNMECKVIRVIPIGSHDFFIAEVVAIQSDLFSGQIIEDDRMVLQLCNPINREEGVGGVQLCWKTLPHLESIDPGDGQ